MAYIFINEGYNVYGWSNRDYYPYDPKGYCSLVIGKPGIKAVVGVSFNMDHDVIVSRAYNPTREHGSSCLVFKRQEEDASLLSEDIKKIAFVEPVRKYVKGVKEYRDVLEWYERNKKWGQYYPVQNEDVYTWSEARRYVVGCIDCEVLGIPEDLPEGDKVFCLMDRVRKEKRDTWERYGKRVAVGDYLRGLDPGCRVAFETDVQREMLMDFHVPFTEEEISDVLLLVDVRGVGV